MSPSQKVAIRGLRDEFLEDVIRIHRSGLGYTLNSRLGRDHLAFLYQNMSKDPGSYVGVALIGGQPTGIVSGTVDAAKLKSRLLRSMSPRILASLAVRLLLRPGLIIQLWQGNVIAAPVYYRGVQVKAVLTAIAVDPAFRGQGIGTQLITALEGFFSENIVQYYRLDTLIENSQASHFYRTLGFSEIDARADSLILVRMVGK